MPKPEVVFVKDWLTRNQIKGIPTPSATKMHVPISHKELTEGIIETLGFRQITLHSERYAVVAEGDQFVGIIETDVMVADTRLVIGFRNCHNRIHRLSIIPGCSVPACENLIFFTEYEGRGAKHTPHFSLSEFVSISIDQIQRSIICLKKNIEILQGTPLSPDQARLFIYGIFTEGNVNGIPRHLDRLVHGQFFEPEHEVCRPHTRWSLCNAFANAILTLDPYPQFSAALALSDAFRPAHN